MKKRNYLDRPYSKPKFTSKRQMNIWYKFDEIYSFMYLWPHKKKEFEQMLNKAMGFIEQNRVKKEI